MRVALNQVEGDIAMRGVVIAFTPSASAASIQFKATDVTQLLRSRKDLCSAKLVVEDTTYLLKFDNPASREELVEMIVKSQTSSEDAAHSPEQWVAASICGAAVDVGLVNAEELNYILTDQYQRGVAQVFDALESLVDGETLQLRVVTEQMENDIMRQIPILAAVFERVVVDAETKRAFWEAVVRKYFCFSRTFLETEMHQLGQVQAQTEPPSSASPAPASAPAPEGLSAINATSLNALPKSSHNGVGPTATADEEDEFAALRDLEERGETTHAALPLVTRLFRGVPRALATSHARHLQPSSEQRHAPLAELGAATKRDYGPVVVHRMPAEATSRDVLEALRKFWRQTSGSHSVTIPALQKGRNQSIVERLCVERAKAVQKPGGK